MIYFFIFVISFLVVYLTIPNIRYIALRFSVVDKKNHRKIHKKVITKLGGLGIYFGFLIGLATVMFFDFPFMQSNIKCVFGLVICSTLMLLLGIYDDFQGSNATTKFLSQITIALLLVKIGFRLENIVIPGIINIEFGRFSVPLTILWLVGVTNAINLIDGLDGLASGIVSVVCFFLCIFGFIFKQTLIVYVSLALFGANLAFLKYNFFPAKIFMGDTGSLFLGFAVASLAIYRFHPYNLNNLMFLPAFLLLLLPIADTALAVIRRAIRRQHIFRSDSSHLHHYLIKKGYNQVQTVIIFYIMSFCLGIISLVSFTLYKLMK